MARWYEATLIQSPECASRPIRTLVRKDADRTRVLILGCTVLLPRELATQMFTLGDVYHTDKTEEQLVMQSMQKGWAT